MKTALAKSVFILEWKTKIETPVRTGLLRNSYRTEQSRLQASLINYRDYWVYVNARNPFMKRWILNSASRIKEIFEREIESMLNSLTIN